LVGTKLAAGDRDGSEQKRRVRFYAAVRTHAHAGTVQAHSVYCGHYN